MSTMNLVLDMVKSTMTIALCVWLLSICTHHETVMGFSVQTFSSRISKSSKEQQQPQRFQNGVISTNNPLSSSLHTMKTRRHPSRPDRNTGSCWYAHDQGNVNADFNSDIARNIYSDVSKGKYTGNGDKEGNVLSDDMNLTRRQSDGLSSSFVEIDLDDLNPKMVQEEEEGQQHGLEESEDLRQERSNYHVILVDDEESIRSAVGTFLYDSGYQVTTFADAETALKILLRQCGGDGDDNHGDTTKTKRISPNDETTTNGVVTYLPRGRRVLRRRVDVVISDVRMPDGMNGLEFLSKLRNHRRTVTIPVVLLTAKGQVQDRIDGYNAGADAYIPKPFDPEELVTVVDNLIAKQKQMLLIINEKNINDNPTNTESDTQNPQPNNSLFSTDNGEDDEDEDALVASTIAELQQELGEIKRMLLEQGGGGTAVPGFVRATNVFFPPDEQEILELICLGKSNKEIAQQTYRSTRRVEQLITRMFRKAQVSNRTELVRWAVATGHVRI